MTRVNFDMDDMGMKTSTLRVGPERLKPAKARSSMRSCSLIGQKLGSLFEVPNDDCTAIDGLLRELDRKTCG